MIKGLLILTRLNGSIGVLSLEKGEYSQRLKNALVKIFKEAGKEFIKAALLRVKRQTGMSAGTFLNIARVLGISIESGPGPTYIGPMKYYGFNKSGPVLPKTPESGAILSSMGNIGGSSSPITLDGNLVKFAFEQKVLQYHLQEFGLGKPSTQLTPPWNSFQFGRDAFIKYLKDNLNKKLPRISASIVKTDITFGRTQGLGKRVRLTRQETFRNET